MTKRARALLSRLLIHPLYVAEEAIQTARGWLLVRLWLCPEHGRSNYDEDGCCVTCGQDCNPEADDDPDPAAVAEPGGKQ